MTDIQEKQTFLSLFDQQRGMIVFIIMATAGFFWFVVIPINNIQTQLASIQEKLAATAADTTKQLEINKVVSDRLTRAESSIEQFKLK